MKKLFYKRLVLVALQAVFMLQFTNWLGVEELAQYYLSLAVVSIMISVLGSYIDYYILNMIKQARIRRGSLLFFMNQISFVSGFMLIAGLMQENVIVTQLSSMLVIYITTICRNHYNILGKNQLVINLQVIEGLIKVIFLQFALNVSDPSALVAILSQWVASFSVLCYFYFLNRNRKNLNHKQFALAKVEVRDILKITTSAAINSLMINILKIVLSISGDSNGLVKVGIAQHISGTVVQSVNAVLQIHYGAKIIRNKSNLTTVVRPTVRILSSTLIILIIFFILCSRFLPENIANVGLILFVLVFLSEAYIIPLSYLVRFHTGSGDATKILHLHIFMLAIISMSVASYELFSTIQSYLITNAVLGGLYFVELRRTARYE